jgi:lipopolysaccharide export system permease protein
MKSTGVSLFSITLPILLLAIVSADVSGFINFYYAPKARTEYKEMRNRVVLDNPLNFLQAKRFINVFPNYSIYIGEKEGNELKDFWIWELDDQKRVKLFLRANEGSLIYNKKTQTLLLTLLDGTGEHRPDADPEDLQDNTNPVVSFQKLPIELPLAHLLGKVKAHKKSNMMTVSELLDQIDKEDLIEPMGEKSMKLRMQVHQNGAMAFASISFVLIAIPLAIKVGRKETMVNVVVALLLAIVYYFIMNMASWLSQYPHIRPDIIVWIPNVVYCLIGLIMFRRVNRH